MSNEYRAKVFKSGNSLALRLPKALGLQEGVEMTVREDHGKYTFEPTVSGQLIDLTGIAGSIPGLKLLMQEDRMIEDRELDWEGKRLNDD